MHRLLHVLNSPRITVSLIAGFVILGTVILVSAIGPFFVDVGLAQVAEVPPSLPPSAEYLLGTDSQGRDMLAVMIRAIPQTLKMGLIAGLVGSALDCCLGSFPAFLVAHLTR